MNHLLRGTMNNNFFKKTCGLVNYSTYNGIRNSLPLANIALGLSNLALSANVPSTINDVTTGILWLTIAFQFFLMFSHGEKYTKDITEINNLYQIFLKNYNKLNKIFNFNNPVEIYAMFDYLLKNGYLSQDKKYEYFLTKDIDTKYIYGSEVMTGKAVCRHNASMLCDIFNDYGISSKYLSVYSGPVKMEMEITDHPNYNKEEILNIISWLFETDNPEKEKYLKLIEACYETKKLENNNMLIDINFVASKKNDSNHAITYVDDGKTNYFFDPTTSSYFQLKGKNNLYSNNGYLIVPSSSRKIISDQACLPVEDAIPVIDRVEKNCEKNMDIFEQFYNENKELYDDVSDKVERIRKIKNPFLM